MINTFSCIIYEHKLFYFDLWNVDFKGDNYYVHTLVCLANT